MSDYIDMKSYIFKCYDSIAFKNILSKKYLEPTPSNENSKFFDSIAFKNILSKEYLEPIPSNENSKFFDSTVSAFLNKTEFDPNCFNPSSSDKDKNVEPPSESVNSKISEYFNKTEFDPDDLEFESSDDETPSKSVNSKILEYFNKTEFDPDDLEFESSDDETPSESVNSKISPFLNNNKNDLGSEDGDEGLMSNTKFGCIIRQGRANEDRLSIAKIRNWTYLAVFDGHGGPSSNTKYTHPSHCVLYLQKNLHHYLEKEFKTSGTSDTDICNVFNKVFIEIDDYLFHNHRRDYDRSAGSCGTIVLITDDKIFQVNLGDCRSIIFNKNSEIINETVDCTPNRDDENNRIISAGGFVSLRGGCKRVNGILAVSRAFGDFEYKIFLNKYSPNGPISVIPEILITSKNPGDYIVLGSDGLIEGCKGANGLISKIITELKTSSSLKEVCENVTLFARLSTTDDISMVLASIEL